MDSLDELSEEQLRAYAMNYVVMRAGICSERVEQQIEPMFALAERKEVGDDRHGEQRPTPEQCDRIFDVVRGMLAALEGG